MQKTLEFRRTADSEPMKSPEDQTSAREQKAQLRLMARDVLGDIENLFVQHMTLTKLELQQSKRFVKASTAMLGVGTVLLFAGLISLLRTIALALASSFEWTAATTELVNSLLLFAVAGIMLYIGVKAAQKLQRLPDKILKQWKEEWQWLRKNL